MNADRIIFDSHKRIIGMRSIKGNSIALIFWGCKHKCPECSLPIIHSAKITVGREVSLSDIERLVERYSQKHNAIYMVGLDENKINSHYLKQMADSDVVIFSKDKGCPIFKQTQ